MQVKIKLKKGETIAQAHEELLKAISVHSNTDHEGDKFADNNMETVHDILIKAQKDTYQKMLKEIFEELDK